MRRHGLQPDSLDKDTPLRRGAVQRAGDRGSRAGYNDELMLAVYVDDFGVLGMFGPGMSAKDGRVRFIYFSIRRRFISLGFKVHKEEMGPVITALGLKI